MWTLAQVQAEYRRLDRLLGIDTSRVAVSFSRRMTRQYGVCTFVKNRPQEIRLADFLRREDQVFWDTARHEYAHAAAAILTGKRHGRDVPRLRSGIPVSAAWDSRTGIGGKARRHPLPPVQWEEIQS